VDMNLHVARTLDARDGFAPGTPWANKGADQFDPRIIEMEKEYARELLSHVNPYTGMSYLKDPVVAVVELNNEDALWREYLNGAMDRLGEPYATVFRNQWNDWLLKKYGSGERLQAAWKQQMQPLGDEMIAEGRFDGVVAPDGKTWILDKGSVADMADASRSKVRPTAEEIQYLAGQHVLHQRVHREIPAQGRLLFADKGIHEDLEVPVAPPRGLLGPGHGDVDVVVAQAHDAKARPHGRALAQAVQYRRQRRDSHTVHLDVDVLVFPAQQKIADTAPHVVGPAPGLRHCGGNPPGHGRVPVRHRRHPPLLS